MASANSNRKDRPKTRFHGRVEANGRECDHPHCEEPGEFRAPPVEGPGRDDEPRRFRWFCLDHIREFNSSYNFFEGMSSEEIHRSQRPLSGWERETRAFAQTGADQPPRWREFADPLDAIGARFREKVSRARQDGKPLTQSDRKALQVLGLGTDADRKALRQRYSKLVRQYHPDRNGGDRTHEHALQRVIEAYQQLKSSPAFA